MTMLPGFFLLQDEVWERTEHHGRNLGLFPLSLGLEPQLSHLTEFLLDSRTQAASWPQGSSESQLADGFSSCSIRLLKGSPQR